MAGEVSHVEFGVADEEQGKAFYSALFGWGFETGPHGGLVIRELDVAGGIHGHHPGGYPYVFFRVDDLEAAVARVLELGGTVEDLDVDGDPDSQAAHGRFKLCVDDQGSPFG